MIRKAYKTEINPTKHQHKLLMQSAGCARLAWNWGLDRIKQGLSKPNAIQLHKELNAIKKDQFPFMYDVSKCCPQESLRDLEKAYKNMFAKRAKYPVAKSRNRGIGSFRLTGLIKVTENVVQLPKLGKIKLKETDYIPTDRKILSATVSEKSGRWFVSILVEEEIKPVQTTDEVIGIDLGISALATCSDGSKYANHKHLQKKSKKVKRFQRWMSRKVKGSQNRAKVRTKLSRLHVKVSNARKDSLHKITSDIVKTKRPKMIVMEDLNANGMMKNRKLSRSIQEASFGEFRRQIEYKCRWFGVGFQVVDRFFPSSKMCSTCGCLKEDLTLKDRIYTCSSCSMVLDRDLNAAYNLRNVGIENTVSSTEINAYGDDHLMNKFIR